MTAQAESKAYPSPLSPIDAILDEVYARYRSSQEGVPAPHLRREGDPHADRFGLAVATADGHLYARGDARATFAIGSLGHVFLFAMALQLAGPDLVFARLGQGEDGSGADRDGDSPLGLAGALCATSLLVEAFGDKTARRLARYLAAYVGRPLTAADEQIAAPLDGDDSALFEQLCRAGRVVDGEAVLAVYRQFVGRRLSAVDLAVAAAAFANLGTNPVGEERILHPDIVPYVLSALGSHGLCDERGQWVYQVGAPAMGGPSGGVMAVLPGQIGIAAYAPLLDRRGNSVRGVAAFRDLAQVFGLQVLKRGRSLEAQLRTVTDLGDRRSTQARTLAEREVLDKQGSRVPVFALRGSLEFSAGEYVSRELAKHQDLLAFVLDLRQSVTIDAACTYLLSDLAARAAARQTPAIFVGDRAVFEIIAERLEEGGFGFFDSFDEALEHAEDVLLHACLPSRADEVVTGLADNELMIGLGEEEIDWVAACCDAVEIGPGEHLIRAGDLSTDVFFLLQGRVRVQNDSGLRLAVLSGGNAVGEMALIDGGPRSADVVAMTGVTCLRLTIEAFEELRATRPDIAITVMTNLSCMISWRLRDMQRLTHALER